MLDQAIFTSARTSRGDGYQLVARSEGVTEAEAKALAAWGPSHDSLIDSGASAVSYNAFRLESGRMCISRTLPSGAEFSQRGGLRVYTQLLLVSGAIFEKFASNAFAILKATLADGHLKVLEKPPAELPRIQLTGRASVVDRAAVDRLRARLGGAGLAAMMQVLLGDAPVGATGTVSPYLLYTAAINCLPPECRGDFSFTTGLKYSVRRPTAWFVAPADVSERRQVVRASSCALLDTAEEKLSAVNIEHGWARFLRDALGNERAFDLAWIYSQQRGCLSKTQLDALGEELVGKLANGTLSRGAPMRASGYLRGADSAADVFNARVTLSPEAFRSIPSLRETRVEEQALRNTSPRVPGDDAPRQPRIAQDSPRAGMMTTAPHAPHRTFEQSRKAAVRSAVDAAGAASAAVAAVETIEPETLEALEKLDDLVFEAIDGSDQALARLRAVWPQTLARLNPRAIEESREQYLRRAKLVWDEHNAPASRRPDLAAAALEVLTLLLGGPPEGL